MKSLSNIIILIFLFSGVVAWRVNEPYAKKTKSTDTLMNTEGFNFLKQLNEDDVWTKKTLDQIHWLLAQVPRFHESRDAKAGLDGKYIIDPSPHQLDTLRAIETLTTAQVQPVFTPRPCDTGSKSGECRAELMLQMTSSLKKSSVTADVLSNESVARDYELTMSFQGPESSRAVINKRFVVEGDALGNGLSIYKIKESSVTLRKNNALFELRLNKYGNDGALTHPVRR